MTGVENYSGSRLSWLDRALLAAMLAITTVNIAACANSLRRIAENTDAQICFKALEVGIKSEDISACAPFIKAGARSAK